MAVPTTIVVSTESIAGQELGPFFCDTLYQGNFLITRSENTDCKCFYTKKKKKFYFGSISNSIFPFTSSGDALDAGWLVLGLGVNVGAAFSLCTKAGVETGVFGWVF